MNGEGSSASQSPLDRWFSTITLITLTCAVVVVLLGIVALYWAWFDFLIRKPPVVSRVWAVVATTAVLPIGLATLYVGYRAGAYKADAQIEGIGKTMSMLHRLSGIFRWRRQREMGQVYPPSVPDIELPPIQQLAPPGGQEIVEM